MPAGGGSLGGASLALLGVSLLGVLLLGVSRRVGSAVIDGGAKPRLGAGARAWRAPSSAAPGVARESALRRQTRRRLFERSERQRAQ